MLVEYEAPKQAEAVVEKIREVLPAEVGAALEAAKPRLIERPHAHSVTSLHVQRPKPPWYQVVA